VNIGSPIVAMQPLDKPSGDTTSRAGICGYSIFRTVEQLATIIICILYCPLAKQTRKKSWLKIKAHILKTNFDRDQQGFNITLFFVTDLSSLVNA